MALLTWNIRGLSGARTKREILTVMTKYRLEIVGLLESRVRRRNHGKLMKSFEKGWQGFCNTLAWEETVGDSIWVLWNPQLWPADILVVHKQLIHALLTNSGGLELLITFIHGRGAEEERRLMWAEIINISLTFRNGNYV